MKPLIIINHAAARVRRAWPIVIRQLDAARVEFDSYETLQPADATIRTRAALRLGATTIAVVGGDGTLSEAAEGFFEFAENLEEFPRVVNAEATLAILPAGTGDDFARGLTDGNRATLEHWVQVFISHCRQPTKKSTRLVDVLYGRCNGYQKPFLCLNASTMGIGGETAARVAAQGRMLRRLSGEARFATAAIGAIAGWRERRVRVSVDGRLATEGHMNLAAVANARYAGGGMMLSPDAKLDDGKLDVVIASGLSRMGVLRELTRIHKGGHLANPKVRLFQGTSVRIETFSSEDAMPIEADGNLRGFTPVEFRVMPQALKFLT